MSSTKSPLRKPIPGFPGHEADTDGNIWSCLKVKGFGRPNGGTYSYKSSEWKKMKISKFQSGYSKITLRNNGKRKTFRVHRLVLETFVGPCPKGMQACHNNGVRTDNRLENLRWDTCKNNHEDKKRHGTTGAPRGINAWNHVFTEKQVRVIKWALYYGVPQIYLVRVFKCSRNAIFKISKGKTWSHILI